MIKRIGKHMLILCLGGKSGPPGSSSNLGKNRVIALHHPVFTLFKQPINVLMKS